MKEKELKKGDMVLIRLLENEALGIGKIEDLEKNRKGTLYVGVTLYDEKSEKYTWVKFDKILKIFRPKVKIEFETYLPE